MLSQCKHSIGLYEAPVKLAASVSAGSSRGCDSTTVLMVECNTWMDAVYLHNSSGTLLCRVTSGTSKAFVEDRQTEESEIHMLFEENAICTIVYILGILWGIG